MSVGNTASFAQQAAQVIIEINLAAPLALEGFHDIYVPHARPEREPIPLTSPLQRIGATAIAIDPARIAAIVITDSADSPSNALPPDAETDAIARHVVTFLEGEVAAGRMGPQLLPLQAGIGTIANAVLQGLSASSFRDMTMYSEVLQDSAIALLDSGHLAVASAWSIPLTAATHDHFLANLRNSQHRDQHDPPISPAAQGPSEHAPHAPAAPQFAEQLSTPRRRPKRCWLLRRLARKWSGRWWVCALVGVCSVGAGAVGEVGGIKIGRGGV